jgi:hypothetical protein
VQPDLIDALVGRLRSAALSSDAHRRGWDAVRTAKLLRDHGKFERALGLLDEVVARFEHVDVVCAAYACAVAIHCDRGEPATGISVGRTAWRDERTSELGNALARAYWERFEQTGDLDDRAAWRAFKDELKSEPAPAV